MSENNEQWIMKFNKKIWEFPLEVGVRPFFLFFYIFLFMQKSIKIFLVYLLHSIFLKLI